MDILLTGPSGLFREGIAALLRGFAQDARVRTSDVASFDATRPDCIVIDGDALNLSGDAEATLRAHAQVMPVIVLLSVADRDVVARLIAAGVSGCVAKSASCELLFSAMRLAFAGGVYYPRAQWTDDRAIPAADASDLCLTPRQIEVLALLARGLSNKAIARRLDVTEATVKTHLTTIFRTLNVSSRGEASALASRMEKIREAQARRAIDGHAVLGKLLAHMHSRHFRAGDVLFRQGDPGGELFYVERGAVRLKELNVDLGPGTVFGEIGLFSPERRRTSTAVCGTDCDLRTVSAADAIRLYYQEPEFALYLIQLVAGRLQADMSRRV